MDARERWQALQSRLTAARIAFDRGDRNRALAEVDAALAIDPSFLAATALRERIVSQPSPRTQPPPPTVDAVSREGYANFERRARRRRVDRKIEAAKEAMARRNLRAAASALDEVIELDPNLPELSELTAAFDDLRRARASSHRGPTIAAGVAFGMLVFGASWLHEGRELLSHPFAAIAHLVDGPAPDPLELPPVETTETTAAPAPVATSGRREPIMPPTAAAAPIAAAPVATTAILPPVLNPPASAPAPAPPAAVTSAPLTIAPAPAAATPVPGVVDVPRPSLPPPSRTESDEQQIARALQQYRTAYDQLDARRAQTVWPAVNEAALARAFDSLASQTITFDACRTQLNGDGAVATCHGSARYVPKVGSREPRVEPRTWTFIMRRAGGEWKIDSARAER